MLRSDRMTFCEMYLQPEAAYEILSQLGEMSCVEFLDVSDDSIIDIGELREGFTCLDKRRENSLDAGHFLHVRLEIFKESLWSAVDFIWLLIIEYGI